MTQVDSNGMRVWKATVWLLAIGMTVGSTTVAGWKVARGASYDITRGFGAWQVHALAVVCVVLAVVAVVRHLMLASRRLGSHRMHADDGGGSTVEVVAVERTTSQRNAIEREAAS